MVNQAAIDAWQLRDITCRNYILATNEQGQKKNIYGLFTAREMWLKIETQYASNAADIENNCLTSLYNYKHDPGKFFKQCYFLIFPNAQQTVTASLSFI